MFRLVTYNIANARRDEKFQPTRLETRFPLIQKQLGVLQDTCDVIMLQEIRGGENIPLERIQDCFDESKFHLIMDPYSEEGDNSYYLIILIRKEIFPVVKSIEKVLLKKIPKDYQFICLIVKVYHGMTNKLVTLATTHFPYPESDKNDAARIIRDTFLYISGPAILAGDFNTFVNKDGAKQRRVVSEVFDDDACKYLFDIDDKYLEGTFHSYSNNSYKNDATDLPKLDYVYFKDIQPDVPARAVFTKKDELDQKRDEKASDHFAIVVEFNLC